jgi:opacity protein-like surface antigen
VFGQYNQVYRDFDGDVDNDYMLYAPSAGFTYVVEEGLNLRLGAGYFYQDVDNDDDEEGPFGNGQIDKTWTSKRGFINLTALTGLAQNDFGADSVGLERYAAIQGSAEYAFLRNLSGDIGGSYRYSDVVGTAEQNTDDDTGEKVHRFRAGAGLTYNPLKWMAIRLGYNFNKVKSENNEDEYDEHRGLLNITLTPSQPYRFTE